MTSACDSNDTSLGKAKPACSTSAPTAVQPVVDAASIKLLTSVTCKSDADKKRIEA